MSIGRCVVGFLLATGLSFHGLKKKSLNMSGAIAAFLVGFIAFAVSMRFGSILILFYYSSSKLTKLDEKKKEKLEDDFLKGGQRNVIQVFANSLLATIIAIIYYVYIGEDINVIILPHSSLYVLIL
jgi:uncharacterized membrane protein